MANAPSSSSVRLAGHVPADHRTAAGCLPRSTSRATASTSGARPARRALAHRVRDHAQPRPALRRQRDVAQTLASLLPRGSDPGLDLAQLRRRTRLDVSSSFYDTSRSRANRDPRFSRHLQQEQVDSGGLHHPRPPARARHGGRGRVRVTCCAPSKPSMLAEVGRGRYLDGRTARLRAHRTSGFELLGGLSGRPPPVLLAADGTIEPLEVAGDAVGRARPARARRRGRILAATLCSSDGRRQQASGPHASAPSVGEAAPPRACLSRRRTVDYLSAAGSGGSSRPRRRRLSFRSRSTDQETGRTISTQDDDGLTSAELLLDAVSQGGRCVRPFGDQYGGQAAGAFACHVAIADGGALRHVRRRRVCGRSGSFRSGADRRHPGGGGVAFLEIGCRRDTGAVMTKRSW